MSWQLWVLIATAVCGLTFILAAKFWQAQQVFDRIVEQVDDSRADELASHRGRHVRAHRRVGHHGIAGHARRHP